jgi:hypothetical protein
MGVLYNIGIGCGIPMEVVQLIKMGLSVTYTKTQMG